MSIASLQLIMPKQNLNISKETIALYRDILSNQISDIEGLTLHIDKVATSLHGLNRISLDGNERLLITEHIINLYILLIRQFRDGNLSLDNQQISSLTELSRELSITTKLLLRDAVAHSKEELANFVYWIMCTLAEQLTMYCLSRKQQPDALWSEFNKLYLFSETRFLTDFQSNKPDNRDIESLFKQTLLFQAAQPDHLHDNEQVLLLSYLTKWAFRGHLNQQDVRNVNSNYFYIDLESAAGINMSRRMKDIAGSEEIRALNPLPIIEQVRIHMKQLRNSMTADKIGFPKGTDSIDAFMVLKKALTAWKQLATRRFERAICATTSTTAFGLKTIHSYLSSPNTHTNALLASATLNLSKTGACIELGQNIDRSLFGVGDIVIHKVSQNSPSQIGAIRWLKQTGTSLIFGIEYIIGDSLPVNVKAHDQITEAILISTSDNDALITRQGCCASNTSVQLKNTHRGVCFDARVQALVQRGHHVDQIRLKRSLAA